MTGHHVVCNAQPSTSAVVRANPPRNTRARLPLASAKRDTPFPVNGCQAPRDRRETVGAAQAWVVVVSDTA